MHFSQFTLISYFCYSPQIFLLVLYVFFALLLKLFNFTAMLLQFTFSKLFYFEICCSKTKHFTATNPHMHVYMCTNTLKSRSRLGTFFLFRCNSHTWHFILQRSSYVFVIKKNKLSRNKNYIKRYQIKLPTKYRRKSCFKEN